MGIPIVHPDEMKHNPREYVVIIAMDMKFVEIDSIMEQLSGIGVEHIYHHSVLRLINTFWRYNGAYGYAFHELNTYKIVSEASDKIKKVRSMLSDDKSVYVYDAFIEKLKYNISDYSDICEDWHDHYFSDGILRFGDNEILVDGGAFDGADTIKFFKMCNGGVAKAYAFEPDDNNYARLCDNIQKANLTEKVSIYRAGLYNVQKNIDFIRWGNYGSRIGEGGKAGWSHTDGWATSQQVGISTVCLDDVVPSSEKVTLIKLDVEGVEIEVLTGAKRIITENRPKMALSIYHRIEDLWEIPLLLKSMVSEYNLYVRHHSFGLGDKILYATI